MKIAFLLFFILLQLLAFAQKTQEEMEKLLKELQENTARGQKYMKRQSDSLLKESELQKSNQKTNIHNDETDDDDEEKLLLKLPPKNHKLLSELSKTVLTKSQLIAYIQRPEIQLQKKTDPLQLKASKNAILLP